MSQPLNAVRLRAALHLLSLAGADISNIVRAHAQSLDLQVDVCQPLSRECAAALDAVIALSARSNECAKAACTAAPSSFEGIESSADWFGDSGFGGDFDFAFPALQHREGGGQMTFQFAEALSSAINSKGGLTSSSQDFSIDSILAEASTDPRFASFVAEATTHNISYHSDGNIHGVSYVPSAPLHSSLSPPPTSVQPPPAPSAKKPVSSHTKVPPRKRAVADVDWGDTDGGDAAGGTVLAPQPQQSHQPNAESQSADAAVAAEQPTKTLASIVDIDAFLARVHRRN